MFGIATATPIVFIYPCLKSKLKGVEQRQQKYKGAKVSKKLHDYQSKWEMEDEEDSKQLTHPQSVPTHYKKYTM